MLGRVLVISLVVACGRPSPAPESPASDPAPALSIPPGEGTSAALAALARAAAAGEVDAAWRRAHYLLDLFDAARFGRSDDSLRVLRRDADPTAGDFTARTPAITAALVQHVGIALDRVLALDRLHEGALAARALLAIEADPATSPAALAAQVAAARRIAGEPGPLRANAVLRLAGICEQALRDAARAPPDAAETMAAFCLYPLYEADPAPHLTADPRDRPPPPDRAVLAGEAAALAASAADAGRLAGAADATAARLRALADELAGSPAPPLTDLPLVPGAAPYRPAPRVALPPSPTDADLAAAIEAARRALADGADTLALMVPRGAPASALLPIADAAAAAGAARLSLLVGTERRWRVPAGDYWSERAPDGVLRVAGTLPLTLGPGDGGAPDLGLHLLVAGTQWSLLTATGRLAEIPAADVAALRAALAEVRAAYDDAHTLVLVPRPGAAAESLARAAGVARAAGFDRQSLAAALPPYRAGDVAGHIARRKRAVVEVEPELLAAAAVGVRRCYQRLLEDTPRLAGTVRLERAGDELRVAGAADRRLAACATEALDAVMRARETAAAEVTFRLQ